MILRGLLEHMFQQNMILACLLRKLNFIYFVILYCHFIFYIAFFPIIEFYNSVISKNIPLHMKDRLSFYEGHLMQPNLDKNI